MGRIIIAIICLITWSNHALTINIPPEWVRILKTVCESNKDVVGYPLIREVATFSSTTKLLEDGTSDSDTYELLV